MRGDVRWGIKRAQGSQRAGKNHNKFSPLRLPFLVCLYSKVVRRVSVNERSSLYRREHHKEAMVWQERGRQPEPQDDDEDRQTDNELHQHATIVSELSVLKENVVIIAFCHKS